MDMDEIKEMEDFLKSESCATFLKQKNDASSTSGHVNDTFHETNVLTKNLMSDGEMNQTHVDHMWRFILVLVGMHIARRRSYNWEIRFIFTTTHMRMS